MTHTMAGFGITAADFDQITADALDDEVLLNTPRHPAAADIRAILLSAGAAPGRPLPRLLRWPRWLARMSSAAAQLAGEGS